MRAFLGGIALCLVGCGGEVDSVGALSGQCGDCHQPQAQAHQNSRHARAGQGAVFRALRARAVEELGAPSGAFCDGCHRPAVGTGFGLSCVSCHAARGNLGTANGRLVHDLSGPVRGTASTPAPHQTAEGGFLQSSDLCGTCHEVDGPRGFSERPFSHYQAGSAAREGLRCQDCHMSAVPGVPDEQEQRPAQHWLKGLDDPEPAQLLAAGVELRIVDASAQEISVELHNRFGGHDFPDGASFLRALWLEVSEDGRPLGRRPLTAQLLSEGQPVVLPTEADAVEHRGLGPDERRVERFARAGAGTIGTISACIRFQRYAPEVLQALGLSPSQIEGPSVSAVDVLCTTL